MTGVSLQQTSDVRERLRQYHNDPTIKVCFEMIKRVVELSTPTKIAADRVGEIRMDEQSEVKVKYWQGILKDYVRKNYSDIVTMSE